MAKKGDFLDKRCVGTQYSTLDVRNYQALLVLEMLGYYTPSEPCITKVEQLIEGLECTLAKAEIKGVGRV